MGFVVIGGMTAATAIAIFLIPVSFYLVEKWTHRGETAVPVNDKQEQDHE
jgi:HAE1 family hydrophobic/amphiphilic exporter-1